MEILKKLKNKLKNKTILTATIANIITILVLLNVIDVIKAELWVKIIGLVILTLVQIGIVEGDVNSGQ